MNNDFSSILAMGSERVVADLAVKVLEDHPDSLRNMLDLCWLEEYPMSMRAARAAQLYCEKHPEEIYPFLDEVVEKIMKTRIDGVRRNFLKVIAEFIDPEKINEPGILLNTCFDWLLDPRIKPATRIHSMTVIYKLCRNEPDILRELATTIEMAMEEGEISIKTCGRKMLARIGQQSAVGEVDNLMTTL
jgi:hypothetical protein